MWELIRANKRNSIVLMVVMAVVLLLVGFVIGLAWFGPEADDWTHLRTYRIRHALPADADDVAPAGAIVEQAEVLVCGDHCANGSINGAMASGRRAAESLLGSV